MLLQLLEDGRLTDGQGHLTDFRNAVITMTSNIGISEAMKGRSGGIRCRDRRLAGGMDTARMKSTVLKL